MINHTLKESSKQTNYGRLGFKGLIPLLISCQNNGGKLKCARPFKASGCAQETSQQERKPHWVLSKENLWSHCAIHLSINPLPSLSSVSQILWVVCNWRVLRFFKKGKRNKTAVAPMWKKKRKEKAKLSSAWMEAKANFGNADFKFSNHSLCIIKSQGC